jgi:FkbM family methyltransferase
VRTPVDTDSRSLRSRIVGVFTASDLARSVYTTCSNAPVLGWLLRRTAGKLLGSEQRVWVRIPHGPGKGLLMSIAPRFDTHYLEEGYESKVQHLLAQHLKPGACLYDLGANIGFFSILATNLVGKSGKVVAFEPEPANAEILRATAKKNDLPQLQIVEAAVWSSSGTVEFERANAASSRVHGHLAEIYTRDPERAQVNAITLDDFVFRDGGVPPSLLKMDVEGAEFGVLQGAAEVVRMYRPLMICEIHYEADMPKISAWLTQRGYYLYPTSDYKAFPAWCLASPEPIL